MSDEQEQKAVIGEVVVTPREVLPGQSLLVEIHGPEGRPYRNEELEHASINGVTGARQYLQFARPGVRTISVAAKKDGRLERATTTVTVKDFPEAVSKSKPAPGEVRSRSRVPYELPLLHVSSFHDEPYRVGLSVGGQSLMQRGLSRLGPIIRTIEKESLAIFESQEDRPQEIAADPISVTVTTGTTKQIPAAAKLFRGTGGEITGYGLVHDASMESPPETREIESGTRETTLYHWDFGDGTKTTSYSERVEHDYREALDPKREHQQFDVALRIEKPDGTAEEVKRTLTVFNAYAMCRKRGVIVPPTEQQMFADINPFGFFARLVVSNVEDLPLILTHKRVRIIAEDWSALCSMGPVEALERPIEVSANGKVEIPIPMPFSRVPKASAGFTVYFFGDTGDGTAIRVEGTFDIWPEFRGVCGGEAGDMSVPQAPDAPLPKPAGGIGRIIPAESMDPAGINRVVLGLGPEQPAATDAATAAGTTPSRAGDLPQPVENEECDPYNLPELTQQQTDEGWACQACPEVRHVETPSRFLNALKGDIILSPGGNSIVGRFLSQVDPPQRYDHSGIMTRNFDQVTHSTASEGRVMDHPNGSLLGIPAPLHGFVPEALKYMWPGVITQTVEKAVTIDEMLDPDNRPYKFTTFSCRPKTAEVNGIWEIVPPLVVKPDPLVETSEIRSKLGQVADDALSQTGKSHYRLFCYSDPTIGQRPEGIAPQDAGWAAGTYPSACSAFIWMTLKRQGVHLECGNPTATPADLEPADVSAGAEVGPGTPDGLYHYTRKERLAAAERLREDITRLVEQQIEKEIGIFPHLVDDFTGLSERVGNQFLNAFASDWAETAAAYSDAWRNPPGGGDADTVSPDNILLWDSPTALGLYGFASPLSYRNRRIEDVVVHRWKKSQAKGKLTGRVLLAGNPVVGARVQLCQGKTDLADINGNYTISDIPLGSYTLTASTDGLNGVSANASLLVNLTQPEQTLDVVLSPPAENFRRLRIWARIATTDHEWVRDEHAVTEHFQEVDLGPDNVRDHVYFEQRMGGEIRIELTFRADWLPGGSVQVSAEAKMFEGWTESTKDLADEEDSVPLTVAKDEKRSGCICLYNSEFLSGDTAVINFTAENLVQP